MPLPRTTDEPEGVPIARAAELLAVSSHKLRFYESEGLVTPARTKGGQRRYSDSDLDWLRTLVLLRGAGMPLSQLRDFARSRQREDSLADQVAQLETYAAQLRTHLATVRRQLRATEKLIVKVQDGTA